ncbi:hypothetical protein ACJ73_06393 [Blastomyces percursus]|uniref:Uncharacterized protein n=1 Tax=Blastomyces percursus TaxID=1658174 RepID=A0A1J9R1B0_9EURO|nr:hypothetical protein ACJ73_06393 [Blastomyces percursus]
MEPSPPVASRRKRLKARAKDWLYEKKAKERKNRVSSNLGTGVHHLRKSAAEDGGIPQQQSDDSQIVSTGSVQALPEQSNTLPATLPHRLHWPENLWDETYANLLDQKRM